MPSQLDANGVASSTGLIVVSIEHAAEGEATAEVWLGPSSSDLHCVHDDTFLSVSGAVIIGDADYVQHVPAEVGEGLHRVRVLVDKVGSPERVVFEFTDR